MTYLRKKTGGRRARSIWPSRKRGGEIVAFLDGDDWWLPGKVAAVTAALEEKNPGIAGVGHGYYEFIEATGESKLRKAPQPLLMGLSTPEAARRCWLDLTYVHLAAFTVRRSILDKCIPIPENLIFDVDAPIAMAAIAHGALYCSTQPLLLLPHPFEQPCGRKRSARRGEAAVVGNTKWGMKCSVMWFTRMLLRMGVPPDSVSAFLDEEWVHH